MLGCFSHHFGLVNPCSWKPNHGEKTTFFGFTLIFPHFPSCSIVLMGIHHQNSSRPNIRPSHVAVHPLLRLHVDGRQLQRWSQLVPRSIVLHPGLSGTQPRGPKPWVASRRRDNGRQGERRKHMETPSNRGIQEGRQAGRQAGRQRRQGFGKADALSNKGKQEGRQTGR